MGFESLGQGIPHLSYEIILFSQPFPSPIFRLFEKEVRERDSNLFEADERIHQLEQQLEQQATAASTDQSAAISTAATIDNANLREQLNHASSRIVSLEDQLADSTQAVSSSKTEIRTRSSSG